MTRRLKQLGEKVTMDRVDDYKHVYPSYAEAGQVKNGQPYWTSEGWMVTTPTPKVPYYRPRQKRRAEQLIEKALQEG